MTGKAAIACQRDLPADADGLEVGVAETVAEDDAATHYDLGIAYREMGLLDDAVGEFEIAARSAQRAADACFMVALVRADQGRHDDALAALVRSRGNLPPIRFDCGTEDFLIEPNRELHRGLTAAGIPHRYEEFAGAHTWDYWEQHLPRSLRFFAAQLKP
jgi:tetratricopeptide (TPR) repeat protein